METKSSQLRMQSTQKLAPLDDNSQSDISRISQNTSVLTSEQQSPDQLPIERKSQQGFKIRSLNPNPIIPTPSSQLESSTTQQDSKAKKQSSALMNMMPKAMVKKQQALAAAKAKLQEQETKKNDEEVKSYQQEPLTSSIDLDKVARPESSAQKNVRSSVSTAKTGVSDVTSQISVTSSASTQSLLFDPNERIDDNSMVGQMVKTNIMLLQKCIQSKNKSVFGAAIENLKNTSNNFGPALNKHLPVILPIIKKKLNLSNPNQIASLIDTLTNNGGAEAEQVIEDVQFGTFVTS